MITFEVKDMTCGHCVSTITKAVRAVDKEATVRIELQSHQVQIEPTEADADELRRNPGGWLHPCGGDKWAAQTREGQSRWLLLWVMA